MKENRNSLVPKNITGKDKHTGSNQSNMKSNNESKNRKSTNPMMFQRNTTFSSLNKSSDPRPIKEGAFQEECYEKILDYFAKYGFEKPVSKSMLASPTTKDFIYYFTFLAKEVRPDWDIQINKLDEDLFPYLNELRYPGYITRTHLISVGAPTAWPHLLALLAWMAELATYLNYENSCEEKKCDLAEPPSDFIEQRSKLEDYYHKYLTDGFKNTNKTDNFTALENFQKQTEGMVNMNHLKADKFKESLSHFSALTEEIEKSFPDLDETSLKLEEINKDLTHKINSKNAIEKKLNDLILNLEKDKFVYDSKCEKNSENTKVAGELEDAIKNQKVSFDEFEKLKHSRSVVEKNLAHNTTRKNELSESVWTCQKNIENSLSTLQEKIKITNSILEKQNINKFELIQEISNELIQVTNSCNINLDLEHVSASFTTINSTLQSLFVNKKAELKEREEFFINLKSELLKLEDSITEAKEKLSQKSADNERENSLLTTEKEKYTQLNNQKNEELKKITESINRIQFTIAEKEKELEEGRSLQSALETRCREEEEFTSKAVLEMETEYKETEAEMKKIKNDNIRKLQKVNKTYASTYDYFKKQLHEYESNN